MKLTLKEYNTLKIEKYLKTSLCFFFNGVQKTGSGRISSEKKLRKTKLESYKVFNSITKNLLKNSIYSSINFLISSTVFFVKPSKDCFFYFTRHKILNSFEPLFFVLLSIKLNNKIYSKNIIKKSYSVNYKENKLILHQFSNACLKLRLKSK